MCLRAGECVGEPVKMCTIPEPGSGFYTTWKNSVSQTRSESFRTRCVGVPYSQPTRLKYLLCFYPTFLVSFFSFSLSFSRLIPFSSLSFFSSIHLLTSSSSSFFSPFHRSLERRVTFIPFRSAAWCHVRFVIQRVCWNSEVDVVLKK